MSTQTLQERPVEVQGGSGGRVGRFLVVLLALIVTVLVIAMTGPTSAPSVAAPKITFSDGPRLVHGHPAGARGPIHRLGADPSR
jgi:hypothetical protein